MQICITTGAVKGYFAKISFIRALRKLTDESLFSAKKLTDGLEENWRLDIFTTSDDKRALEDLCYVCMAARFNVTIDGRSWSEFVDPVRVIQRGQLNAMIIEAQGLVDKEMYDEADEVFESIKEIMKNIKEGK